MGTEAAAEHAVDGEAPLHLGCLPPIYVLPTHLSPSELQSAEERLVELHARLTYDIIEARLILGVVGTKRRIEFELRSRQLWTDDVTEVGSFSDHQDSLGPPRKKPRIDSSTGITEAAPRLPVASSTESEGSGASTTESSSEDGSPKPPKTRSKSISEPPIPPSSASTKRPPTHLVRVIKLRWLHDSEQSGGILPVASYTVYLGEITDPPSPEAGGIHPTHVARDAINPTLPLATRWSPPRLDPAQAVQGILDRARSDVTNSDQAPHQPLDLQSTRSSNRDSDFTSPTVSAPRRLLQQTTSQEEATSSEIPEPPAWVQRKLRYACQRATRPNPPNAGFINELRKIKLGRTLTLDEVGVRAYSTSIAALAAYPHPISSAREIVALPGCDTKIANLWVEWKNTGTIQAVEELENDSELQVIRRFYDIWGVGATTAREMYDRGWTGLDDVVEFGWKTLTRVQQIGIKFYDEFQTRVPREEVESIASTVHEHAVRVRDRRIETVIAGSYRRGSKDSGDVDIIVSHRHLDATEDLVTDIVTSLEGEGWITHTLTLHRTSSQRGQATLPFRAQGRAGHGFDSLDKALVVWQDPTWPTRETDLAHHPNAQNPAPHRRVDIIISPWRTVGCATLGWTGATSFERDLRRYSKASHNWKFDSSGVRNRTTGQVVPLEGPRGVDGSIEDAERKVFEGLGLEYRRPSERWTD